MIRLSIVATLTLLFVFSQTASAGLVINEFLADPDTDWNGDSNLSTGQDEFVELVNSDLANSLDISNWQLFSNNQPDDGGLVHTFTAGTTLLAGQAIVVFGGGVPSGAFGGSLVQTGVGSLFLNQAGGGTLEVLDSSGVSQAFATYGSGLLPDVSQNLDPDIFGTSFVNSTPTPGFKSDGTPFNFSAVPEPSSLALSLLGLCGFLGTRRSRRA